MLPLVVFLGAAAVGVSGLPAPQAPSQVPSSSATQPLTTATVTNACAQVSQATAAFLAESPSGDSGQNGNGMWPNT